MHHRNLSSEIIRLRRGLNLPFTPAEEAQPAQRDTEVPRDKAPTPAPTATSAELPRVI